MARYSGLLWKELYVVIIKKKGKILEVDKKDGTVYLCRDVYPRCALQSSERKRITPTIHSFEARLVLSSIIHKKVSVFSRPLSQIIAPHYLCLAACLRAHLMFEKEIYL